MQERQQLRPTESIDLHENGGLTSTHWEEVIKIKDLNTSDPKIVAYGKKVVRGEFPNSGNHHRQYLGNRHWVRLAYIWAPCRVGLNRIANIWSRFDEEHLAQIRDFAKEEQTETFSLNDHISYEALRQKKMGKGYSLRRDKWSSHEWNGKEWVVTSSYESEVLQSAGSYYDFLPIYERVTTISNPTEETLQVIANRYLLLTEELEDPLHSSPQELLDRLMRLARIDNSVVRERLIKFNAELRPWLKETPLVGHIEREIA